jgi:hypothetical protein
MNAALLYRSRRRWVFWIALACAVGIHVEAVVLAKGKSDAKGKDLNGYRAGFIELVRKAQNLKRG